MRQNLLFLLFSVIAGITVYSCSTQKPSEKSSVVTGTLQATDTIMPLSDDSLFLAFEKTPCYGTCPAYLLKIYNKGYVSYEGRSNVKNIGKFYSYVGPGRITEIKELITSIDFFNLKSIYELQGATDLPGSITTVKMGKKIKTVKTQGGFTETPAELKNFERFLDNMANELKYRPVVQ